MKMMKIALAAMAMTLPLATPLAAQEFPLAAGEYVQMNGVVVEDGPGSLEYAKWLATEWKRFIEYSKSQGWISGYAHLRQCQRPRGRA